MPKGKRFDSFQKRDNSFHDEKKVKLGILSEDVMSYYRNVSTSLEGGFEDDAPLKDQFLTNVYATLMDEGIQVSQNQTVSRILEMLFHHSEPHHMHDLFCHFCGNLTIVAFDRFASHVFQSLVRYLPAIYADSNKDKSKAKTIHSATEQLCKFMESHMRDVMTHTYASHVLRSLLEALGGVYVEEEIVRSRVSRSQRRDNVQPVHASDISSKALSKDFHSSFENLKEKLIRLCNFEDHLSDQNYCPVLQTVLLILHKTSPAEYWDFVNTIIQKTCLGVNDANTAADDVTRKLPDTVQNEVGSYLIELLISLASETQLQYLYDQLFKGKLIYFAVHPIANYVLQKLLSAVSSTQMMEELLTDISQYMEDILAVNHIGIITKLAEACRRTGTGQDDFLKALMKAFHCYEPAIRQLKIVPLLASLQTYETFFNIQEGESEPVDESSQSLLKSTNIHGSLVLQQLLQFSKPKQVVSSLLALTPTELAGLCCDKCGSHVIDVFIQSPTILNKNSFLHHLKGLYINIACNRNGSRCLESIWKGISVKQRIMIAEELSESQERLESDQWGRFLYRNFGLFKFTHRRKEWMELQGANSKKQQLLQNILQGNAGKKNKKVKDEKPEHVANTEEANSESSVTDQGKPGKKRKHQNDDIPDLETDKQSAKKMKKEKKTESSDSHEAEAKIVSAETSGKKKRKRNKEKRRTVRNPDLDITGEIGKLQDSSEVKGELKKKKKKKTIVEAETVEEVTKVKKKKSKKVKVQHVERVNEETPSKLEKSPKSGKKKNFEKKGKLKNLKIKS